MKKLKELLQLQTDKKSVLDNELQKYSQIQQSITNCQANLNRQQTVAVERVMKRSDTSS